MVTSIFPFTDALCKLTRAKVVARLLEGHYKYCIGWPHGRLPCAGPVTRLCDSREELEQLCRQIAGAGLIVLGELPPVEAERRRYLITENFEPTELDGFEFVETEPAVLDALRERWSGTRDQYLQVFDLDTGGYWEWRTDTADAPDALSAGTERREAHLK